MILETLTPLAFRFFCLVLLSHSAFALYSHEDMTTAQMQALGELPQFNATVEIGGCSGTMLSSERAIFAAHCVGFFEGARTTVRYYENGALVATRDGTVHLFDNENPRVSGEDLLALVKLDTPFTATGTYVAPYDQFDEVGQLGWQTGRGSFRSRGDGSTDFSSPNGFYRAVSERFARGDVDYLGTSYQGSPVGPGANPGTTRYEGSTAPGDSGGAFYIYSRGRFFNASTVFGAFAGRGFLNNRVSTHLNEIETRSGSEFGSPLKFAYPQQVVPVAHWVAEDLALGDGSQVGEWTDRIAGLSFSSASDGGMGAPAFADAATPTGLGAVAFDGDDTLGLSAGENPFAGETAMSVVMVVKLSGNGSGLESEPFFTTGILDTSSVPGSWGLSYSDQDRIGWSIEPDSGAPEMIYRGGAADASLSDGQWHVVVATWDGSEITQDNAGDDRNMKLFVNSVDQSVMLQGPSHINVGRNAVSVLLGGSQINGQSGFDGEIAELRFYTGELQLHEVDRVLSSLRAQYVSGSPGVVFQRPWVDHIEISEGSNLRLRGELTGGATSALWSVESGTAAVTFSDINSPNTDVIFDAAGPYHLRITASDGTTTGIKDLFVDVTSDSFTSTDTTARAVPGNWISSEIGLSATGGGFTETSGQFAVTGAGVGLGFDEGETYDHGHFVWKGAAGDFDWSARLNTLSNQNGPTRAGIMLRGGAGPTDAAAFVGRAPDGQVYALFRRDGGVWGDLTVDNSFGSFAPLYYKLERRGNVVTAYTSADGISYTSFASAEVALPGVTRAGFFVTSGDPANTVSASFDATSLQQIGYADASTVQAVGQGSADAVQYNPSFVGADEPWLALEQESGPAALEPFKTFSDDGQIYKAAAPLGGTYGFRFLADDGNTISFSSEDALVFQSRYDFNIDGLTSGWTTSNIANVSVASSLLTGTASTGDPQLVLSGLNLDGSEVKKIAVRFQASINGAVTLFWGIEGASGFSSQRRLNLNYTGNGAFQTLFFDLAELPNWAGQTVTNLRIDTLGGSGVSGASLAVDSIDFLGAQITEATLRNLSEAAGQTSYNYGAATISAFRGETTLTPNALINSANLAYIGVDSSGVGSDPNLNAITDNDGVAGGADQERLQIEIEPTRSLSELVWNWSTANGAGPEDGVTITGFKADPLVTFSGGVNEVSPFTYTQADGARRGALRLQITEFSSLQRSIFFNNPAATAGATLEITVAGAPNSQFAILSMAFLSESAFLSSNLVNSGAVVLAGGADNLSGSDVLDVSWQAEAPLFDVSPVSLILAGDSGAAGGFIQPSGGAAANGNADSIFVGRDHALDSDRSTSQRGFSFEFTLDASLDLQALVVESGHVNATGEDAGGSSDLVYTIYGGSLAAPLSGLVTVSYGSGSALQAINFDLVGQSIGAGTYVVEIYQTGFVGSSAFATFGSVALLSTSENQQSPAVGNGGFEIDTFTTNVGKIFENAPITGWIASADDRAGLNPSSRSPFANNGVIPEGSNAAFLQANGGPSTLTSTFGMTGLEPGETYQLSFRVNARAGGVPDLRVLVDNTEVLAGFVTAVGGTNPYKTVSYNFVANSNMMPLAIQNTMDSGDTSLVLDDFTVRLISEPKMTVAAWTGNADSGITDTQAYTHAFNLGTSASNTTINGVNFIGVPGSSPSVPGSFSYTMPKNLADVGNAISDTGSADLAQSFVYDNGNASLTLEGLEAGKTYRTSLFSVGFGSSARTVTFFLNEDSLTVDHSAFGDNNGLRVDFEFVATGTSQIIQLQSLGNQTFHTYALTNALVYSYDAWQADFPELDLTNPNEDADSDGIANILEAWYGTHPGVANAVAFALTVDGLTSSFNHPQNVELASDLSASYQWSPNLSQWYAGDGIDGPLDGPTVMITPSTSGASTTVTASELTPRLFFRIVVTQQP